MKINKYHNLEWHLINDVEWREKFNNNVVFNRVAMEHIKLGSSIEDFLLNLCSILLLQNETLVTYNEELLRNNPIRMEVNIDNYETIKKMVEKEESQWE